ncbi:MAG: response regulator transcription factor [Pseudoxanthomonas sp.]
MDIVLLTPTRLLGDGISACMAGRAEFRMLAVVNDLPGLRDLLSRASPDLVLIDVTLGIDLHDVRAMAAQYPEISLMALGLTDQRQEVVQCGRAGFAGYVTRDASVDELCRALLDVAEGRLTCSAEVSCGLMQALFRGDCASDEGDPDHALTQRESQVLQLIGQGLSNKEIARELSLSISTVKHHVHNVLDKLQLPGRTHAMRRVRDAPWLGPSALARQKAALR